MAIEQRVVIRGEDRASAAFKQVGESAKSMGTKVFELTTTVSSLINIGRSVASVMGTVAKAFAEPVRQALDAEKAQALLAAKLRATGEQAGYTAVELNDLAGQLSKVTTFGDDAITSAQGLLLSYTNISRSGGAFERTLTLALDLSTALGEDLESSTRRLGKALNEPKKAFEALAEVGVAFTAAEKQVMQAMIDTGRVAEAQAVILGKLEGVYAGTAAAARDTFGGALTGLKNAWDDVMESIGKFLTQNEGVKIIINAIVETVQGWADSLNDLGGNLDAQAVAAEAFRKILVGVLVAVEGLLLAFSAMGKITAALVDVITMLGGVIGWAIKELTGGKLDDALEMLASGSDKAAGAVGELREKLAGLDLTVPAESAAEAAAATVDAAVASETFTTAMRQETAQAGILEGALRGLAGVKQLLLGVQRQIAPEYDATRRRISALLGELRPATETFEVWIGQWEKLRESASGPLGGQLTLLQRFEEELRATVELSKKWRQENAGVAEAAQEIADAHEAIQEPQEVVIENTRELAEEMRRVQEEWDRSIESMTTATSESFRDIFVDAFSGVRSLEDGFTSFGQTVRAQLARAILDPILGAQGPLAQLFNPVFNALKNIGTAIATQFIQPLITGFLSYIGIKTAAETTFAATATAAHAASVATIAATTAAALGGMMPALTAAATASLIATFGGSAAAAALLPGLIAVGSAQGAALAATLQAGTAAAAFADGGRVTRPTFALVGEAGPETIIPEGRPDRARDLLDDLFSRRPGLGGGRRGGAGSIFINNQVTINGTPDDPEALAERVYDALNRRLGRAFRTR